MPMSNQTEAVRAQYATADALDARARLHELYSENKQPFGEWILEQYGELRGLRVLELGCGTASAWAANPARLAEPAAILLSDLSEGMLAEARRSLAGAGADVSFAMIDAQDIPLPDGGFDVVIANMMLYHLPDIGRALGEVARVLRPAGRFFCATYGEHGLQQWLSGALGGRPEDLNHTFTLQNGEAILRRRFAHVELRRRADALRVTNVDDLLAYVRSAIGMCELARGGEDEARRALLARMEDGAIRIPKEYGMFAARGPVA